MRDGIFWCLSKAKQKQSLERLSPEGLKETENELFFRSMKNLGREGMHDDASRLKSSKMNKLIQRNNAINRNSADS